MSMKDSLHMTINFKRPEAMKSLNNNLGGIPGGRISKLSSTLWLKNPKPTKADWPPLLLLLLAAMTYNQVQSVQINDYANHYVDIEITGYKARYNKNIASRGVAGLISWLGTAGPVDCFYKSVSDGYIRVYRSSWQGTAKFGWAYSWLHP